MLYREIIAVCSEIHTKHVNTLCGQNVELLHVKADNNIYVFPKFMGSVYGPVPCCSGLFYRSVPCTNHSRGACTRSIA